MNQIRHLIKHNKLIYQRNPKLFYNNFILSKDKNSSLSFIEITPTQYRFVFDILNDDVKNILFFMNEESKKNPRIDIENLIWCGGGITILYNYKINYYFDDNKNYHNQDNVYQ